MLVATASISLLGLAAAHIGCSGHNIARRNIGGEHNVIYDKRQVDGSNVDVAAECAPYSYAPMANSKPKYPSIWVQPAALVPGDTEAAALFATINATVAQKVPNSNSPHGTLKGDWAGVNYPPGDADCWWTQTRCTTPAASLGLQPDITNLPEPETWGLGFDDGPNCSHNALYNFLQTNNQKATMFFIGSNVIDWPVQAIRARDDGHHICVHTWSHPYMTALTNEQVFAELYYTRQVIKEVVGVTPTCWRPPYGDVDNRVRVIASALNLSNVLWKNDTFDWSVGTNNITAADVTNNYQKIITAAGQGQYATQGLTVLNHEINNFTMQEFIEQYPNIKGAFKHIVPLSAAMNWTHPYVEQNYTFQSFDEYVAGTPASGAAAASSDAASGSASGAAGSGTGTASGAAASAASAKASSKPSSAGVTRPAAGVLVVAIAAALLL
ncbi:Chitin deacetylase [Vanrija pseudolonga]|uniref:chitin deacetylase n=1 Tax=Vanrija pseudolonga TaxID=143232 RepID=A0AAF1BGM9_9TREE|nr:Chitin deacetylase [Vanrija pseudolonga]